MEMRSRVLGYHCPGLGSQAYNSPTSRHPSSELNHQALAQRILAYFHCVPSSRAGAGTASSTYAGKASSAPILDEREVMEGKCV